MTPPRYEVVAQHQDGRKYLIGYTPRRSRDGIFSMLARYPESLVAALGLPRDVRVEFLPRARMRDARLGDWLVYFSGRTQRDCETQQELPFYLDLPEALQAATGGDKTALVDRQAARVR